MKHPAIMGLLVLSLFMSCRTSDQSGSLPLSLSAEDSLIVQEIGNRLGDIEKGDYGLSWDRSADLFRNALSKTDWEKTLHNLAGQFGPVESRSLISFDKRTSVPGAPDGEYCIVQFRTVFEHKADAVETVTVKFEASEWKLAGYFIR